MSVSVDVNSERPGHPSILVVESLVYTIHVSFTIECFTNYVVMEEIEFSESRFHLFCRVPCPRFISWNRNQ